MKVTTYETKKAIVNEVSNWFADTVDVDYVGCMDAALLMQHWKEARESISMFPEVSVIFRKYGLR